VAGTSEDARALWEAGEAPPDHGPFGGGVQLIFVGDFLQLPPVGPAADVQGLRDAPASEQLDDVPYRLRECAGKPAFMSVCWREARLRVVELRNIHRQRDAPFMRALNAIRVGARASPDIKRMCERTRRPLPARNGVEPTRLFPTNAKCDTLNASRLAALPAPVSVTTAHDSVEVAPEQAQRAVSQHGKGSEAYLELVAKLEEELLADEFFDDERSAACRVPRELRLKRGAQVMLLRNEGPGGFVNGDIGVIVGYETLEPESAAFRELKEQLRGCDPKEAQRLLDAQWPRVRFSRSTRSGDNERCARAMCATSRMR
jgi:ATP-dependent DNA helicase PIF1